MATKEVDPISRIEGHLGAKCEVDASGYVHECDVHGNLWRGFENFLLGRKPNDAITFTQRICGVCPVPHGQTATFAVEAALGYNTNFQTYVAGAYTYSPTGMSANRVAKGSTNDRVAVPAGKGVPLKAVIIRNLVLSAEFLMSSITHQYHLAAPSYIQGPNIPPWTPYFADSYYHPLLRATGKGINAVPGGNANQPAQFGATLPLDHATLGFSRDLWSAVIKSYVHALRIRRLTFEAGAMFAGRMPMTSSFVAGGVSTNKDESLGAKCTKFRNLIAEVGAFIVQEYVPIFLALGALYPNYDNLANATVLNTYYASLWTAGNQDTAGPPSATNTGWGAGLGNFISWGAFPQSDGYLGLCRGYKVGAGPFTTINDTTDIPTNLKEVITHSRYQSLGGYESSDNVYPGAVSRTVPERSVPSKYSWMKAPRYADSAFEVGPLARMVLEEYIVDGTLLRTSLGAAYTFYTKANTGYDGPATPDGLLLGLDPVTIAPDIAVALVLEGLAELWIGGDRVGVDIPLPTNKADLVTAYYNSGAYIMGTIRNWVVNLSGGLSTMDRLRARAIESLILVQSMLGAVSKTPTGVTFPTMSGWVGELNSAGGGTYTNKSYPVAATFGFGGTEAPRGALMHFCTQELGKIKKYQCVVPTTWNGSPKGLTTGDRGAIEEAIVGTKYATTLNPFKGAAGTSLTAGGGVEPLRVAQSFDPCIACAVH